MLLYTYEVKIMDPSQSTAIKDLPFKKNSENGMNPMAMSGGEGPPPPLNTGPDAAARFAQMPQNLGQGGPQMPQAMQRPVTLPNGQIPRPVGPGQGMSMPLPAAHGKNKEYFGLASLDYKSTVVVFALILIFSSTIFYDVVRKYIPMVSGEGGRTTLLGSLLGALLGSIIYLVIKVVAKI
jgi:hypothetical protein